MTREEAIEYLVSINEEFKKLGFNRKFTTAIETLTSNPWHKVSEELPKVDKCRKCIKVFVRNKCGNMFVAFYSPIAAFSISSSFYAEYALSDITHWMSIPEIKED